MERISIDLIRRGIREGIIRFGTEDDELTAMIGDYWFYIAFGAEKDKDEYTEDELVAMVHGSINSEPINAEDDEDAMECLYYRYFILEKFAETELDWIRDSLRKTGKKNLEHMMASVSSRINAARRHTDGTSSNGECRNPSLSNSSIIENETVRQDMIDSGVYFLTENYVMGKSTPLCRIGIKSIVAVESVIKIMEAAGVKPRISEIGFDDPDALADEWLPVAKRILDMKEIFACL